MFKTIKEALSFIESQRVKRSFEDFQKIIERYQIPIDLKNVIHVAGTNGKGSTVTFIKDLLIKSRCLDPRNEFVIMESSRKRTNVNRRKKQ